MWLTAWLLVGSAAIYQPTYPPFRTKEDCEKAKEVYLKNRNDNAGKCVETTIFVVKAL